MLRLLDLAVKLAIDSKEGAVESEKWVSPQGLRTLHDTVTMLKLDD